MTNIFGTIKNPVHKHTNVAIFVPHAGCKHACSFCDQHRISGNSDIPSAEDVASACENALASGIRAEKREIAFFGGSFTAIDKGLMTNLLKAAVPFVHSGDFSGIRVSTRPDAISYETIKLLQEYGVTAVELGAQSMDNEVLTQNGRGHTAEDVYIAAKAVKEAGLQLGLQMMTGLYGADDDSDRKTARQLAELQPDTVRIYPTIVLRGTHLEELYRDGIFCPQELCKAVSLCSELLAFFEKDHGIPVIRLGLHSGEWLENGIITGPWHPAFRELCESRQYRELLQSVLSAPGRFTVWVHPSEISKAAGHKKSNINFFAELGYYLKIRPDIGLAQGLIKLAGENQKHE